MSKARFNSSIINLRIFHNWVKNELYKKASKDIKNIKILELAVGKAGDLYKWIGINAKEVIGIDIDDKSINGKNGAYHRYYKQRKKRKYKNIPDCKFYVMDLSSKDVINKIDTLLKDKKFDIISCQFAIHYFFKNNDILNNITEIISKYISKNGFFIGTTLDGNKIKDVTKELYQIRTNEDNSYFVNLGKRNEDHYFKDNDSKEYKVDKELLETKLNKLKLVESKEFSEWYKEYLKNSPKYIMSDQEREFSFLNFSFMYKNIKN